MLMRLTDKIQIQNKARVSMTLMPLYQLFDKAQKGNSKYAVLKDLDIHYLTFLAFNVIIEQSGDHHQFGASFEYVKNILSKSILSLSRKLKEKEGEKAAEIILNDLMNVSDSFRGHETKFYNPKAHETEVYNFKLIELNRDDGQDYIKLSEAGFMIYFCSDVKGVDLIKEFQAEMTRRFIQRGDFGKATLSVTQGKTILRETQSRISNIRIKTDRALVPQYDVFRDECERIYEDLERVEGDHKMVFNEIPDEANDGSKRDMQIKELFRNCEELIELFAETKDLVHQTRKHLRSRIEHRLNNSVKNAINLSLYDHILKNLILLEPEQLQPEVSGLISSILPARIELIKSPYQIVKEKLDGLFEPVVEDAVFDQKDLEEKLSTEVIEDTFYLDHSHDVSFKDLIQGELDSGKEVTLSYMLNLCANDHGFDSLKLKSLYLYILIQRLEDQRSNKDDDDDQLAIQTIDFKVSRLSKWVDIQDLYFGNDLKIEGMGHE